MTTRLIKCGTCGVNGAETKCDGCGVVVDGMDDAVRVDVTPLAAPSQRAQLDYCHPCAVKTLPAAVGIDPPKKGKP